MLIDDGDRVGENLGRGFPVAVLVQLVLLLVIAQLIEQALAKIAASNSRWVKLPYHFKGFVKIGDGEAGRKHRMRNWSGLWGWLGSDWLRCGCSRSAREVYSMRLFTPTCDLGEITGEINRERVGRNGFRRSELGRIQVQRSLGRGIFGWTRLGPACFGRA